MPRGNPAYRLHRASGQAIVFLDGRNHYLGRYGSAESHQKYAEMIQQHQAGKPVITGTAGLTIAEAVVLYLDHARRYYRDQDGQQTRQVPRIVRSLTTLVQLFPALPLVERT